MRDEIKLEELEKEYEKVELQRPKTKEMRRYKQNKLRLLKKAIDEIKKDERA